MAELGEILECCKHILRKTMNIRAVFYGVTFYLCLYLFIYLFIYLFSHRVSKIKMCHFTECFIFLLIAVAQCKSTEIRGELIAVAQCKSTEIRGEFKKAS